MGRFTIALALACAALFGGCSYGGVAAVGDRVVITRNDHLLFGYLREVHVCELSSQGELINCRVNQRKP